MAVIQAETFEISIHAGLWQLLPTGDTLSRDPVFQVMRGGGVMEYTPGFGEARKLPGTVLSLEYIRAVVIGYDEKVKRWSLGFHVMRNEQDKTRWLALIRWPPGNNELYSSAAKHAGRHLSEYIGCPLKIFGAKKLPRKSNVLLSQSGVTGPLVPHKREDMSPQRVKLSAQSVQLPIQYPGIWLGRARNDVMLRLAKNMNIEQQGEIAPAFNQCVIDPGQGNVRLLPPTGLLGAFFGGGPGRIISFDDAHNVELRHTITKKFIPESEDSDTITEITHTSYTWDVYLTLPDESILLAQTRHHTGSELLRKHAAIGNKFSINSQAGIDYLRQHQADQEAYEKAEIFARTVSIVIASTLGVRLVKTQVDFEEN